jgi:sec-independent protein translocase protein TatB
MLSLSPAKLLVILVIALIVLGPEKLPQVARQMGAVWGGLRRWRSWLETEVRSSFPDLPPTHEVVSAVRSPFAFLDKLADVHESATAKENLAAEARDAPVAQTPVATEGPSDAVAEPSGNGPAGKTAENGTELQPLTEGEAPERTSSEEPRGNETDRDSGARPVDGVVAPGAAGLFQAHGAAGTREPPVALDDPSMN